MKLETIEKLFDLMFLKKTSDKKGFKMFKKQDIREVWGLENLSN